MSTEDILDKPMVKVLLGGIGGPNGLNVIPAALGVLGGGAIGYMSGKDANKLTGEKSTRLRNSIIGALLGGSTAGLGSHFLVNRLYDYDKKYDEAYGAYRKERDRLRDINYKNYKKIQDRHWEERKKEREREKQRNSIEKNASLPYSIAEDVMLSKSFAGYIPTLIGILGGGSAGYFFAKDKDKKNKLINTLLGATAGGSIGFLGSLLGARYEAGSNKKEDYYEVLEDDPTEGLEYLNYKDE